MIAISVRKYLPRTNPSRTLALVLAIATLMFLMAPIVAIVPLSFTSGTLLMYPLPGFSTRWYEDFFSNRLWVTATANSFKLALPVTLIATVLGVFAALGLDRLQSRWKTVVLGALLSPMVAPVIIFAVAVFFFFARIGLAGGYVGLVIAHVALAIPFVIVSVTASLKSFDRKLAAAAATCGAPPWRTFTHVTAPLIMPGVISGAIMAFVTSFDEVVVVLFLSGPDMRTLPRQIWSGVREDITPTVVAAAVLLIGLSLVMMILIELLRQRGERLTTSRRARG